MLPIHRTLGALCLCFASRSKGFLSEFGMVDTDADFLGADSNMKTDYLPELSAPVPMVGVTSSIDSTFFGNDLFPLPCVEVPSFKLKGRTIRTRQRCLRRRQCAVQSSCVINALNYLYGVHGKASSFSDA